MSDEPRDVDPSDAPAPTTGAPADGKPTQEQEQQGATGTEGQDFVQAGEASPEDSASDAATPADQGDDAASAEDGDETDGEVKPKKLSRSQRERRAKIRAIERAEFAEREAEELRRRLAESDSRPPQQQSQRGLDPNDPEPTLEDFQNTIDPNGFHKLAHDDWRRREMARARESEESKGREATERKQREFQQRMSEYEEDHAEREDEARKIFPDYDTVSANVPKGLLQHAPELVFQIAESEKSALLQYHFGKNPDALVKIAKTAQRDVLAAAREIWRIESRLSLPQTNRTTKAPPPFKPPQGGGTPPPTDIRKLAESDDITAYAKARDRTGAKA